jgi:hypothetical protein
MAAARLEAQRATTQVAKAKAKSSATANKKRGRSMSRKWPYIVGVITAGAAVGAGVYVARKRRNARNAAETANALTGDARNLVASVTNAGSSTEAATSAPAKDAWTKTKEAASRDGKTGKVLEPTGL